jgi:hypothetical protein
MTKKIKIEFAPGAFDSFEGSQEELDELIAEITRMAESGELEENARPIDFENPNEEDIETITHLLSLELNQAQKKLQ